MEGHFVLLDAFVTQYNYSAVSFNLCSGVGFELEIKGL